MDRKTGIILLAVALVIILTLVFSNKAKATTPASNTTVTPPKTTGPVGKKAYAISDFRTLYDLNMATAKNLMKDEYVGVVTGEIAQTDIAPVSYQIDSVYQIPEAFVYLK